MGLLTSAPAIQTGAEKIRLLKDGPQPGHYLWWNDQPILLIGDSVTQGWMECGTNFNQRGYVDALAARGLNLLMLWAFKGTSAPLQQQDKRLGYDAPELWPWAGSPDTRSFDLRRFNPAYFDRLKELVAYAEAKRIVVLITVHDGWTKICFDGHPFNRALGNGPLAAKTQYVELADDQREMPEEFIANWSWREQNQYFQEQFCAKLIAELQPFSNVVYEMFNEGEWYDRTQRQRHEQHFLAFFRARCANLLLSNSDHITGDDPHRDAKVDLVTLHNRGWVGHFSAFAEGFHITPPKPYLYSEPVPQFDGNNPSLEEIRRSVWETTLAGADWVNQNDPSFGWDSRAAIAAKSTQRDRAYDDAGHCARFFNQSGVRFWEMSPQGKLASTGVCLAQPGLEYVIYSAFGERFTVDLAAAAGKELNVRWSNPSTGEFRSALAVTGGNAKQQFEPPFAGDAVLHLCAGKEGEMSAGLTAIPRRIGAPASAPATKSKTPASDPARLERIRAAKMPLIPQPVMFNTPEADAICSALEVFPPDNPWNQIITDWPLHPNSKNLVASVGNDKPLRYNPDMAFILVPPDQKRIEVKIAPYASESDRGPYPLPENVPIEGWPVGYQRDSKYKGVTLDDVQRDRLKLGGDRHALVVDPVNRLLYEFHTLRKTDAGWQASQASIFDLKSNDLRPRGWTSADAAGLPIFPAVVRYDELKRGKVDHALRVTVRRTRRQFIAPATHDASKFTDENLPRMGERFRLRQDFDVSGFSPEVRAILTALKRYGMFVADNGIEWAISVAPDERIPVLHQELRKVKGSDFEVVVAPQ